MCYIRPIFGVREDVCFISVKFLLFSCATTSVDSKFFAILCCPVHLCVCVFLCVCYFPAQLVYEACVGRLPSPGSTPSRRSLKWQPQMLRLTAHTHSAQAHTHTYTHTHTIFPSYSHLYYAYSLYFSLCLISF